MTTASATEVKNRFGDYLDRAQQEPVIIEKSGRRRAVLLSHAEYERLRALDDYLLGLRAREAEQNGFLGVEASMAYLAKRLQAADAE